MNRLVGQIPFGQVRTGRKPEAKPRFGQARPGRTYQSITVDGQGKWHVPDHVTVPYVNGDGIGPEIVTQARRATDAAVRLTYGLTRSIQWIPLLAGVSAEKQGKDAIPQETIDAVKRHRMFVKGPTDTPIGGGRRSVNVQLRQIFDLFACIRPVKTFTGVETALKGNKPVDLVIFRENTEDVYAGVEFDKDSAAAAKLRQALKELGHDLPPDAGIGIKFISETASKRLVAKAIQYALDHNRPSVTLMHKGNIMKYTEGAFLEWGKEVAQQQFGDRVIMEDDFYKQYGGDFSKLPKGKVVLQDRIADNLFQQVTLNPQNYSVIAAPNLNGDYLSDDTAALAGGLGLAPGANIGDQYAMFEATHGTAPKYAGADKANPTAMILSTMLMLNHMGWTEAADLLLKGVETAIARHQVTQDLARTLPGVQGLGTQAYTDAIIQAMEDEASGRPNVFSQSPVA